MNEYYKGKLLLKNEINFKKIKFVIDENNIITIIKPNYKLSGAESHVLYDFISNFKKNEKFQLDDEKSYNIIHRITYKYFDISLSELTIIYEKVITEDGMFAKEINTGLMFPLLSLDKDDLEYNAIYKDKNDITHGSITTELKLRDCFETCSIYNVEEKQVTKDEIEKYLSKKKKTKFNKKLQRLYNMNKFKYDINIKSFKPIKLNNNSYIYEKCEPTYQYQEESINKQAFQKTYKLR